MNKYLKVLGMTLLVAFSFNLLAQDLDGYRGPAPGEEPSNPAAPGMGPDDYPADFFYTYASAICYDNGNTVHLDIGAYFNLPTGYSFDIYATDGSFTPWATGPLMYSGSWLYGYWYTDGSDQWHEEITLRDPAGAPIKGLSIFFDCYGKSDGEEADIHLKQTGDGAGENRATFMVVKTYDDGNPTPVDVTLSCNTGLPLEQTKSVTPGAVNYVEFVVTDFDDGQLDCSVTEDVPDGYTASYLGITSDPDACEFEDVYWGYSYFCSIHNALDYVYVDVNKIWIDDHPEFNNSTYARARWYCDDLYYVTETKAITDDPAGYGGCYGYKDCGSLNFYGEESSDYFHVYPHWDGTYCHVEEKIYDSGVESDAYDCYHIVLFPGTEGAECTIYNTRFYEGIPTLSQYGLAMLALLMLGVGMIGFRRFA